MKRFTINGIDLEIPQDCLSASIIETLDRGKYEHHEYQALKRNLVPDDRMVDLGAGAGYLCATASQIVGGAQVLGVEAHPQMVVTARANLRRNGGGAGQVLHGAVVPDSFAGAHQRFLVGRPFWGGHVVAEGEEDHPEQTKVPAIRISDIMAQLRPTLVMMDIEGAEADLAGYAWPDHVRMVVVEIHAQRYSAAVLNSIFTGFFEVGFSYKPWGSRAQTLIFERVSDLPF